MHAIFKLICNIKKKKFQLLDYGSGWSTTNMSQDTIQYMVKILLKDDATYIYLLYTREC